MKLVKDVSSAINAWEKLSEATTWALSRISGLKPIYIEVDRE